MEKTKTRLITGASKGLGLALARELAKRGWKLILNARGEEALSAAEEELKTLTDVAVIDGDIINPFHRKALAQAAQQMGGLDALINNAGTLGPSSTSGSHRPAAG